VVTDRYVCISPLDIEKKQFKDKEVKCDSAKGTDEKPCAIKMIKQRFENQSTCGTPEDFSDDLPFQLQDLLKKKIFENLLNAPKFQTDKEIRDEA